MTRYALLAVGLFVVAVSCSVTAAMPTSVKLATTSWCPYACQTNSSKGGIAFEYVSHVLAQADIELEVEFYPWARAIHEVNTGAADGLLTAIPSEAPNLSFTKTPTMSYQVCFFADKQQNWRYTGVSSLSSVSLGVISDYGYGEPLDGYVRAPVNQQRVVSISGDMGINRLLALLNKSRVDVIVDDENVVLWQLVKSPRSYRNRIRQVGCLTSQPFYLALSPRFRNKNALLKYLNSAFKKRVNIDYLEQVIVPKYR